MKRIKRKEILKIREQLLDKYFELKDNEATLTLEFEKLDEVIDKTFKADETLKIEDDFFEKTKSYLELLPKVYDINLIINIDDLEGYSLENVEEIFQVNFLLETYKLIRKNRHRWIAVLLMILIGSVFFVFYSLGQTYKWPVMLNEFLDIACWVFYWEAVTIMFIEIFSERRKNKALYKRIKSIKVSSNSQFQDIKIKHN